MYLYLSIYVSIYVSGHKYLNMQNDSKVTIVQIRNALTY